jgi:superfamily II DNA or RNA helicase
LQGTLDEHTLELREIQQEAIRAFLASSLKASLVLPVGAGKTITAISIWLKLGKPKLLIVVPRIVLIANPWLKEMFETFGLDPKEVGQFYSEKKKLNPDITISLYPTLSMNLDIIKNFEMIIFDEEQFLSDEYGQKILNYLQSNPVKYMLGMTGTLENNMGNALTKEMLPVAYERTIREVRESRILADAKIYPVYISLSPYEMHEYNRLTSCYENLMRNQQHRFAFMTRKKRDILLSCAERKIPEMIRIVKQSDEPTLLFAESVDSIHIMKRALEAEGIPSEVITAKIGRKARQKIIDGFGKTYMNLLSVGTLQVGFNVPHASREIIFGSGTTQIQIEQRMGRVLRIDPENPEKIASINPKSRECLFTFP